MGDEIGRAILYILMGCGIVFVISFVIVFLPSTLLVRSAKDHSPSFQLSILLVTMSLCALGGPLAIRFLLAIR